MASTSQILTWAELECHGVNREGDSGSRPIFNEVHKIFMSARVDQRLIWDDAAGDFPFFDTVDGVYLYSCPSNVWNVQHVVIDAASDLGYGLVSYASQTTDWRYEEALICGKPYLRCLDVKCDPSLRSTPAAIRFRKNPGDTASTFRRVAWRKPTEILNANVQHEMQEPFDVQFLLPATIQMIKAWANADKAIETRRYIEEVLKPAYWKELDKGEHGSGSFCVTRRF
jgi:hypothetical protein